MEQTPVWYVPVSHITIGDRQRTVDESVQKHIQDLAKDIKDNGLIHAITLDRNNNLIAGFCRFSAIQQLGVGYKYAGQDVPALHVPVAVTHLSSENELFRLELMENLRRKNLSPVDEALALSELHQTLSVNEEDWGKMDTADVLASLGRGYDSTPSGIRAITQAELVSRHAGDEDVRGATSMAEAVKIAKKKDEIARRTAIGSVAHLTDNTLNLIQGDAREILLNLPMGKFHGIVTDPPYGVDAQAFGDQTGTTSHAYDDSIENSREICETIIWQGFRVCTPGAHLYMFCDLSRFDILRASAIKAGWTVHSTPLIWKKTTGHMPWPGYYQRNYETILFARKGNIRQLSRVHSDIFEVPSVKSKIHAAEKPVELIKELLSLSFLPGEHVLDPCCGSGSIFPAAKTLNLQCTGIELDETYHLLSAARISDL